MDESKPGDKPATDVILRGVTDDDIKEFLNEKVKNHACPACFTNNWTLVGDNTHFISLIGIPKGGGFGMPPPNIPLAVVACDNCGYVRSHALGAIAHWKSQK